MVVLTVVMPGADLANIIAASTVECVIAATRTAVRTVPDR